MGELQRHKKILKKEVIELRQTVEDVNSQLDLQKHKQNSSNLEVAQERQKSQMLERYVEKMESQVKVQQNMMEMMSISAAASVAGGSVAPGDYAGSLHHFDVPSSPAVLSKYGGGASVPNMTNRGYADILVNTPSSVQNDEDDDDDNDEFLDQRGGRGGGRHLRHPSLDHLGPSPTSRKSSSRRAIDDDNKSHMSELTEDRTQKQFDAAFLFQQQANGKLALFTHSLSCIEKLSDFCQRRSCSNSLGSSPSSPAYLCQSRSVFSILGSMAMGHFWRFDLQHTSPFGLFVALCLHRLYWNLWRFENGKR